MDIEVELERGRTGGWRAVAPREPNAIGWWEPTRPAAVESLARVFRHADRARFGVPRVVARRGTFLRMSDRSRVGGLTVEGWIFRWGIQVDRTALAIPRGWLPLLDRLAADLVAAGWDRRLKGVSSKGGSLEFDLPAPASATPFDGRIGEACFEGLRLCMECGGPGSPKWVPAYLGAVTLCRRCLPRALAGSELHAARP